jgi:Spy/CpxP family protein refolding chaperone
VQAYLELTDQQIKELTALRTSFMEAAQPLMQQIREKLRAMREAREQGASSALMEQYRAELADLRAQEENLRSQYRVQAQATLTDLQKTKLAVLQKAIDLMPVAGQAVGLNLLDGPPGIPGGPGGAPMGGPGFLGGGPPAGRPPRL